MTVRWSRLWAKNDSFAEIMRCPSDDMASHTINQSTPEGAYLYTYTMNYEIASDVTTGLSNNRKRIQIFAPSQKILILEETYKTIDDGRWVWSTTTGNDIATYHDFSKVEPGSRGNCCFVDGHVDFITRADSHSVDFADPTVGQ